MPISCCFRDCFRSRVKTGARPLLTYFQQPWHRLISCNLHQLEYYWQSASDNEILIPVAAHLRMTTLHVHSVTKKEATKLSAETLSNLNRFIKFFFCQTQLEICYTMLCRHFTVPNVCRYTTLWNMNDRKTNKIYRVPKKQADAFLLGPIAWTDAN